MSPSAHTTASAARVPRTLFQHAHKDANAEFPPLFGGGTIAEGFMLMPDNWNGLDALYLWIFSGYTGDLNDISITINIGSCGELFNVHTQTVNAIAASLTVNKYTCLDLTTLFATVLANLSSRDMIWWTATSAVEEAFYAVGLEAQET